MNVLFVTHNYIRRPGDFAGVFLHLLARRLRDEGITVTVLAPHDSGLPEIDIIDEITIHRFRYAPDESETFAYRGDMHRQLLTPSGVMRFVSFQKSCRSAALSLTEKIKFDIITAHWVIPCGPVAARVARDRGVRFVLHSHGTDVRLLDKLWPVRAFAQRAIATSHAWSVVSTHLAEIAMRRFPDAAAKISVCPLPNDESLFFPDPNVTRNPKKIVAVTRFTRQKRVLQLLHACKILAESGVDFSIDIYGVGPLQADVESFTSENNLSSRITLHAPVSQEKLRQAYSSARAVVLNSVGEGFGLTLVEGSLCGAVPIGVRSGGITDTITHEKNGLLAEPDNPQSLADCFKRILTDDILAAQLAVEARASALARFASAAAAKRYAELYRSVL